MKAIKEKTFTFSLLLPLRLINFPDILEAMNSNLQESYYGRKRGGVPRTSLIEFGMYEGDETLLFIFKYGLHNYFMELTRSSTFLLKFSTLLS